MLVYHTTVDTFKDCSRICLPLRNRGHGLAVTFACNLADIVAETESAPMQGCVKFVGVVGDVFLKVEYSAV